MQRAGLGKPPAILARNAAGQPVLVTHMRDQSGAKTRLLTYSDIPPVLLNSVLAIEDHRFFSHAGVDLHRLLGAAVDALRERRLPRGTSTLTQQLVRSFYLTPERTYSRKVREILISLGLETKLTKEQIFEQYCNYVWMGRRGGFDIRGMGEAAHSYFGKQANKLTLAEAALLAAIIQRPSYLNPYEFPDRARARRNLVLDVMLRRGQITAQEHAEAVTAPVALKRGTIDEEAAPYFVDLIDRHLDKQFGDVDLSDRGLSVVTTLDPQLQRIAVEVLRKGMGQVDKILARQERFKGAPVPRPQAALIALDPATGAVKAVVGGRDYEQSQLNRALAKRQPGSAFKPFVFAAALDPAEDLTKSLTLTSVVSDEPTDFQQQDGEIYQPANYHHEFGGDVTIRQALRRSLNVATVKVAEHAGLERVARLAQAAGLGAMKQTSSLALGAYEVTPLDLAGAYTIFANGGVRTTPFLVEEVQDRDGQRLYRHQPAPQQVLDPRVAYLVTNLMEDVVNRGTGHDVRRLDFDAPAAGKTGTDDDGWFVGYTRSLLCLVWVGIDDNRDLEIEGARSALPIWADFMRRAHQLRAYRRPGPFPVPEGIATVAVDPETGLAAGEACPRRQVEMFIEGTQPVETCQAHEAGLAMTAQDHPLTTHTAAAVGGVLLEQ